MMKSKIRSTIRLALCACLGIAAASTIQAASAQRVADAIWAEGDLFDTIGTPTEFKNPPEGSTDVIFSFAGSGLEGQRSVAEAAPGNPEYNGGRWDVYAVTFTELGRTVHDPDGDGIVNFELMDAEAVLHHAELGHLKIVKVGFYFECPLLRGKR